jgi:hypothetical protein
MARTLVTSTLILLLLFYSTVLQRQINEQAARIKNNEQVITALVVVLGDQGIINVVKETPSGKEN